MARVMVGVGKLGRYPTTRRSLCAAFVISSLVLLTSCNFATVGSSVDGSNLDITDKVRSIDLLPRQPQPVGGATATAGNGRSGGGAVYEGSEVTAVSDDRPQRTSSGNGFDLNFENT